MASRGDPEHLVVGQIAKPHGVKGDLYIWLLTDRPDAVYVEGRRLDLGDPEGRRSDDGDTLVVERARPYKRGLLVKFEGVDDRTAAEPLGQRYLLLPAEEIEPLAEGELFYHQLLGLEVETVDGESIGRIREVYETEPSHLLEVKGDRVRLVPLTGQVVKEVDLENGRLVIDPPPGLLDL